MGRYHALRVTGSYRERQIQANRAGAICYAEQHFNALEYDRPGFADNPSMVVVADNASSKTRAWAGDYVAQVAEAFGIEDRGVDARNADERGYWNLFYTAMPAVLLEPFFISDPQQAEWAMSEGGQTQLAFILTRTIATHFPAGGVVALSCGHIGARKWDKGAPAKSHDGKIVAWEGDLAMAVLDKAHVLLEAWG